MAEPVAATEGKRFSRNYLYRGEPTEDSKRMRLRLAALIREIGKALTDLATAIKQEQGIEVPYGIGGYDWDSFLRTAGISDVLDLITTARDEIVEYDRRSQYDRDRGKTKFWVASVRRIFEEEMFATASMTWAASTSPSMASSSRIRSPPSRRSPAPAIRRRWRTSKAR